jgi:hypothetical protein
MADIYITHKIVAINRYLDVPDANPTATAITVTSAIANPDLAGSKRKFLLYGNKSSNQEYIELPAFESFSKPAADYYSILRNM